MAMDINQIGSGQVRDQHVREVAEKRERAQVDEQQKTDTDRVELSREARRLKALEAKAQELPDFDQQKVDAIRSQIADGRYHVDPDKLAEKFIELERELSR